METEIIGPTVGIGVKVYELAERYGWLDKLKRRLKGAEHVLVLGSTGVGKSQFLNSLHVELPNAIDEMARTAASRNESLKYAGRFFDFIDTPGERAKEVNRNEAIRQFISRDTPGGVINIVAYGYHEYAKGRDFNPIDSAGKVSADYLARHREEELAALREWLPLLSSSDTTSWLMTVVTKADLWWSDLAAVREHYQSGEYGQAISGADHISADVATYSSLRHRFFSRALVDGAFDDSDLAKGRERLLRTIFELSSGKSS